MFGFFKKIYQQVTSKLQDLFGRTTIDESTLHELEKILLSADTGVSVTRSLLEKLKQGVRAGTITKGSDIKEALRRELTTLLNGPTFTPDASVYLLVGINGSGKTTFAAKLAAWLKDKKVLLVGADTFRAAAGEQLEAWGKKLAIPVFLGKENQDPASVVYQGCEAFKQGDYDVLIIDTAGRLQTKTNLMKELEKIRKTIQKQLGDRTVSTLLTIDALLGQNSFDQAKVFHESTSVDGIVLTKMDGTGKGGIVFAIHDTFKIPIAFVSFGEQPDQLALFDKSAYIESILETR